MNPAMQDQYATFLLRRNWKGAVQVLKAALEVDPGDAAALSQMEDQRTRFLQQAGSLINEARPILSTGDEGRIAEIVQRLDSQFPEWVELCDSDEVLVGIWNATQAQEPPVEEPEEEEPKEPEGVVPPASDNREAALRDLLRRADPRRLPDLDKEELRLLAKELAEAEVGFALGVKTGGVAKREVSAALADVRETISSRHTRVVLRNVGITVGLAAALILAAFIYEQRGGFQALTPHPVAEHPQPGPSPVPGENQPKP